MNRRYLTLICAVVFILCCSLSNCKDTTPGPSTKVHGVVTEAKTNIRLAGIKLQVIRVYTEFLSGPKEAKYDVITTGTDGTYYHTFTPQGKGTFYLRVISADPYVDQSTTSSQSITLGELNTFNYDVTKLVSLKVDLKNSSDQGRTGFHVFIADCCNLSEVRISDFINKVIIDTNMTYKLPQLTTYTYQSLFFKGYYKSGTKTDLLDDTLSFKKNFFLGKADTTINISNN
jgi:hypothetical protein